ncbi:hypothetical protein ACFYTS_12165 [Nocardia sp. NPDC004151]|uniref:hypothetical protein n=1 Tax=Nocardia sp. NPDC004151 TaxID=3364304 RepID=UPI003685EF8B
MASSPEIDRAEDFYRGWMPPLERVVLPLLRPRPLHGLVRTSPVRRYLGARIGVLRDKVDSITSG